MNIFPAFAILPADTINTVEKVSDDRVWYTPIQAYSDYLKMVEDHGLENVLKLNQFQKVRETKALAILCFAMYKQMGTHWYLQLDKSEVTDGRVMRQDPKKHGDLEKLNVEITTYMNRADVKSPKDSLLEQLKKTKTFVTHHKYGDHDLVLVELGNNMKIDFGEIVSYLRSIKAPYELWAIEQVEHDNPDTIVQVTVCTTKVGQLRMNVGEAWHEQKQKGIRGTLVSQRTADPSKAGIQPRKNPVTRPPWEFQN